MILSIGAGTGRCGTQSLAYLLDGCTSVDVKHENKPHIPYGDYSKFLIKRHKRNWLERGRNKNPNHIGDVAFYWLYCLYDVIDIWSGKVKILFLKRDREETVESYDKYTGKKHHWQEHDGDYWVKDPVWYKEFPKFEVSSDLDKKEQKKQSLFKYYDFYYDKVNDILNKKDKIDNFDAELFPMDKLNNKQGQEDIFDFYEIPEKNRRYRNKCKYNVNRDKS